MKRLKKTIIIELIISITVLIILCGYSINNVKAINRNIPKIQEYTISSNNYEGFSFYDFFLIKDELDKYKISGCNEEVSEVKNDSYKEEVKIVYTDENYKDVFGSKLVKGMGISREDVINDSKVVVIGESLAIKLYKSFNNILGKKITINKEEFTIIGIAEEEKSYSYKLCEDKHSRIYVPYTCFGNGYKRAIDYFGVKSNDKNDEISRKINNVITGKIQNYNSIDNSLYINFSSQGIRVLFLIIALIISIIIIKIIYNIISKDIMYYKKRSKDEYFKDLLIKEKQRILKTLMKIVVFISIIVVLINLSIFNVVVIKEYMPKDNIFDIEAYKEIILDEVQNENEINSVTSINKRYINIIVKTQLIITLILIYLILRITLLVYKTKILYNYNKKEMIRGLGWGKKY